MYRRVHVVWSSIPVHFLFLFFLKRELFFILTKNKGIYVILFKFKVRVIIDYLDNIFNIISFV